MKILIIHFFFIGVSILFSWNNLSAQDFIELKDGTIYEGEIMDTNGPKYKIRIIENGEEVDVIVKRKNVLQFRNKNTSRSQSTLSDVFSSDSPSQLDSVTMLDGRQFVGLMLDTNGAKYRIKVKDEAGTYTDWIIKRADIEVMKRAGRNSKYFNEDINKRAKVIFLEGGGTSIFYGINFDSRIFKKDTGPGFSVGFGATRFTGDTNTRFHFPMSFNHLWGRKPHYAELGIGMNINNNPQEIRGTNTSHEEGKVRVIGSLVFAYRFVTTKDFFFRVGMTPIFSKEETIPFYAGLAIGFKI